MKKSSLTLCLFTTFITAMGIAQDFKWSFNIGGKSKDHAFDITSDHLANTITTGFVSRTLTWGDTIDFSYGNGAEEIIIPENNSGHPVGFILKTDADKNFVWARYFSGDGGCSGYRITTDDLGNIYVIGKFSGTIDFDPGASVFELSTPNIHQYHVFILKLDKSGNFLWAKNIEIIGSNIPLNDIDSGSKSSLGISVDLNRDVYVTGTFEGTTDFDPGNGVYEISSDYGPGVYALKLNSNGEFLWAKGIGIPTSQHMNSNSGSSGNAIVASSDGSIYLTGSFSVSNNYPGLNFDPGTGVHELTEKGVFVLKLKNTGEFVWVKPFRSANTYSSSINAYGITSDKNNDVVIAGAFTGTADFDPGTEVFEITVLGQSHVPDAFIVKLDANGNFRWAKRVGGSDSGGNYQYNDVAWDIVTDNTGNVYTTGNFVGVCDFDPGEGVFELTPQEGVMNPKDIFVLALSSEGDFLWAKNVGGEGSKSGNQSGRGIAIDPTGGIYVAGTFLQSCFPDGSGFELTAKFAPPLFAGSTPMPSFDVVVFKIENQQLDVLDISVDSQGIIMYPNPAGMFCTIKNVLPNSTVKIIDNTGKEIYRFIASNNHESIPVSSFQNGIYVIEIEFQDIKTSKKLIINH